MRGSSHHGLWLFSLSLCFRLLLLWLVQAVCLAVLLGLRRGDDASSRGAHLLSCLFGLQGVQICEQVLVLERLTEHFYLHVMHPQVLLVILVQLLPVLDRHLRVKVFQNFVSLLERCLDL